MIQPYDDSLEHLLGAGKVCKGLLKRIACATEDLMDAIGNSDTPRMIEILEERSHLCEEFIQSSSRIALHSRNMNSNGLGNSSFSDNELGRLNEKIREMSVSVIEKLSLCEEMLSAELQKSRAELLILRQQNGLRAACKENDLMHKIKAS